MRRISVFAGIIGLLIASLPQITAAQDAMAIGQVTKIDLSAGEVTLKHGPIKNLKMEGMTMPFRVQDPAMLKAMKVGDKVKFKAERVNDAITIIKIQKAR